MNDFCNTFFWIYGNEYDCRMNDFWATPNSRDYKNPGSLDGPRAKRKRAQGWTMDLNDQCVLWSKMYEVWLAEKAKKQAEPKND